ncbi:tyrosyl-dna phosphodiesterase domain containing [Pyrenophora seminiperda CCB06]|uniref:Tyrosyl-dna phosphodiesterase domain containing n=1 Tax=Pyrenophora seminiperda CCB06 TaxID=1302712 RepID=A0A3M7M7I3_9PLEO|nr:tyrosyl-dna phosphodiesterase domain containing [Pyrenophora seminiperda CCB06]
MYLDDVGDLARVTRTSRLLYYMMLPRLYEHVTLHSYSEIRYIDGRPEGYGNGSPFAMGLNTLISRNFGNYIQSFRVRGDWREHDADDYKQGRVPDNSMVLQIVLRAALDKMKNLKVFAWELNTPPLQTVYQGLVDKTSLTSLTIRCQIRRTPRPTTIISPLPNLTTLVVYNIDPLCYPDDISLLVLGSKKLQNLKLHWSPRMRAAGEESVNLMSIFGRCVAAKYSIQVKRMAIYNLYTRFSSDDLTNVIDNEYTTEATVINSMGASDAVTVFTDASWRVHGTPQTPPNLKMLRTDHVDKEGVRVLSTIKGMERIYNVSRRNKDSSRADSTATTPTSPPTNTTSTPYTPASTSPNNMPITIAEKECRSLGSGYIAAIQTNHRSIRHLLLSDLWVLSDETLFSLSKALPDLEQFGFACAFPSLETLRQIVAFMPKLTALRILINPSNEVVTMNFDVTDMDLHTFAIATDIGI